MKADLVWLSRHVAQGPELAAKLASMTTLVDGAVRDRQPHRRAR